MARYLGAEEYGTYVYAIGIAELCMLFWTQGLKEIVIHETKKAEDETTLISAVSFQLMAVGNTVLYGILALILFLFIDRQIVIIISLVCGVGIWFRSFEAYELWFHANLKVKLSVRVQFIAQFVYMTSNILLIVFKAPLLWFGITYSAQLIIAGIGFLVLYVLQNKEFSFYSNNWELSKEMMSYGKFMILAKLVLLASYLVDRFLIEYLLNIQAVGFYTAATKMTTTWTFVASSISLSYISVITGSVDEKMRDQNMNLMFGWITFCGVILMIPFYFFSDELVALVFGDGYKSSSEIFRIIIWSLPFLLMNEGVKAWLVITGKTKYYMYITAIALTAIIIGNFILIPLYGLEGGAYAFIISWIFGGTLSLLFFKKTRELGIVTLKSFLFPYKLIKNYLK